MYFGKKGEVGVLLAIGLVLAAGAALFFTATDSVGITGAVVSDSAEIQTNSTNSNDDGLTIAVLEPQVEPQGVISSCQALTNGEYRLNQNVTATNTCFTIYANDITLDCDGFEIRYGSSCSSTDVGCSAVNATNRNGIHIKNCLIEFNKGNQNDSFAIYFKNV